MELLETAIQKPNGTIKDTLFSIADPTVLQDIATELKYRNSIYQEKVHWRIRNSYSSSYRTAVTEILKILHFKSNNSVHQPVIQAIELLRSYEGSKQINFSQADIVDIPLHSEIVPPKWYELVVKEEENGNIHINRINYEICVLYALRDKLKCREIWVDNAYRYRNPEEYLPKDFEEQKKRHYEELHLPIEATEKIADLQRKLQHKLHTLNHTIPRNKKVKILSKKNGWIAIAPNELSPEPKNLTSLKKRSDHSLESVEFN
ncbi:hypothetical protein [Listeria fleischmannii]|uniref:hypothetical protein n=1 Tax=Listeria fleischmannii TaxID=1069827 RepID=UPI0004ADAC1A|nr:hypothetical protein [Listeria fleischmannii]